jgi:hypothetical protein
MSAKVLVFALIALFIVGIVIFRYRAGTSTLHVDPNAAEEIEKAKQR